MESDQTLTTLILNLWLNTAYRSFEELELVNNLDSGIYQIRCLTRKALKTTSLRPVFIRLMSYTIWSGSLVPEVG
jgi:hypothetical protein